MENLQLDIIRMLQEREKQLKDLQAQIATKREENKAYILGEEKRLEDALNLLLEESQKKSNELVTLYRRNSVSIVLSDLVEELSKLSGISILNMGVEIKMNIECPMFDLTSLLDEDFSGKKISVSLCGDSSLEADDNNQPFAYKIKCPIDLKEKQADGKTFLEHCNSKQSSGGLTCYLKFNKRIGDLICKIDFKKIFMSDNEFDWHPIDLMKMAIVNCIEQGNVITLEETRKQKVKEKKK